MLGLFGLTRMFTASYFEHPAAIHITFHYEESLQQICFSSVF